MHVFWESINTMMEWEQGRRDLPEQADLAGSAEAGLLAPE